MDFDQAIRAHSEWKMKLQAYLKKPDRSLNIQDIEPDHKCALGQWIHGEGAKLSTLPEYATLKTEHAKFHRAAASVVRKADIGQDTSADTALGATSEFGSSSTAVVSAIMKMKQKTT